MIIPYEQLSEDDRDAFQHISADELHSHIGDCVNFIWFKNKKTMNLFYKRAGSYVTRILGPQRTGVAQSGKTNKLFIIFYSHEPFMSPDYRVNMNGVEIRSLKLYP